MCVHVCVCVVFSQTALRITVLTMEVNGTMSLIRSSISKVNVARLKPSMRDGQTSEMVRWMSISCPCVQNRAGVGTRLA